jgi:hypothetical protein
MGGGWKPLSNDQSGDSAAKYHQSMASQYQGSVKQRRFNAQLFERSFLLENMDIRDATCDKLRHRSSAQGVD